MDYTEHSFALPNLETAIDRQPAMVTPDTPLVKAIALMGHLWKIDCTLEANNNELDFTFPQAHRSGCILVMEQDQLVGILTERDIVKLTAQELAFESLTVGEVMTHPVVTLDQNNFKDIFAALFLFRRYRIRHLPIVQEQEKVIGVVSPETIRHAIRPANLLKLRRVADVMSKNVIFASLNNSVLQIARLMAKHRVSCIVITQVDETEEIIIPVGIITERDILQFKFLRVRLDNLKAHQVMSTPLFLLRPEDSLLVAHQEMQRRRVRRLVVSWNWGRELGIITQTSILKIFDPMEIYSTIEVLQSTIQQLEQEKAQLLATIKQNAHSSWKLSSNFNASE